MTLASRQLCALVAVLYSSWLVAPLLDPQLHPWTSYASEYFVVDRPAAILLRTADGICGMLLIVIAVLSYPRTRTLWRGLPGGLHAVAPARRTGRRGRGAVRAWSGALAVAGAATVVDAINPMTCAPSVSPECAAAEAAGTLPVQHEMHTVSSVLTGTAFVLAMGASLVLSTAADRVVRVVSWAGIVTIALSGVDAVVTRVPTEGITQRVSMLAIVVWLVTVAGIPVADRLRSPREPEAA